MSIPVTGGSKPSRWQRLPVLCWLLAWGALAATPQSELAFDSLPPLPAPMGEQVSPGLAGAFVGTSNGALIVAGGANFPEGMPWEVRADGSNPPKVYHDRIYTLTRTGDGLPQWRESSIRIPTPLAYGAAVSYDGRVVCAGGHYQTPGPDGKPQTIRSPLVFALTWNGREIELRTEYAALPAGRTDMAGALLGSRFLLACGDAGEGPSADLLALDLAAPTGWTKLAPLPGPGRVLPVAAVQSIAAGPLFYLFSGRNPGKDRVELLTDSWCYEPGPDRWRRVADVAVDGDSRCVMGASAIASGNSHILVIGGAGGDGFVKLGYTYPMAIAAAKAAGDNETADRIDRERLALLNNHPGFSRDILAYHTVTDTWVRLGELKGVPTVTTGCTAWDGRIVVPTGERSPGIRTPEVVAFSISTPRHFGALNYTVLGLYLCGIMINGMIFAKKMKNTDDFFKAGGRIPWWAAGLSIFGTQLSAITFIAIPAKVYATDWRLYIGQLSIVIIAPFVILFFLPFYRRLNVTTAYEYLELRFNVFVRSFASILFIMLQFARIGIVLYLPAVALSIVTGMSVDLCILLMGGLCIVYTVMGGMEAVIWTDVTQVIVLLGGALVCLVLMAVRAPGGWNGMIEAADLAGRFRVLDFRWDLAQPAFAVVLLGALCSNLISYGTDQSVIQRYLTTRNEASAARSIWTNAILALPASMIFFLIGSALFVFFQSNPGRLDPTLTRHEALFPLYIVNNLPAGVSGLLIAGVFAASMSSLDSAMNSVAAAVTTDFYRRFRAGTTESGSLRVARIATVSIGILGTGFAVAMAHSNIQSIWDQFNWYLGLFGGGLGGIFLLAIFTRRTHGIGAAAGLVGSGVVQFLLVRCTDMNKWFFAFTGLGTCMLIGYLVSLLTPAFRREIDGLTIYTLRPGRPEAGAAAGGSPEL